MIRKLKSWVHPDGSGIRIRKKINTSGTEAFNVSYQVDIPQDLTGGIRIRKQFKMKEEAEEWAEIQAKGSRVQGESYFFATTRERNAFVNVIPKLREVGLDLEAAVDYAIYRMIPEGGDKTVGEVVEEMILSKERRMERNALRHHSFQAFKSRTKMVVSEFGAMQIKDVTADQIKKWISGLDVVNRTRKNYLTCISEIVNYSLIKKYIGENPMDSISTSDRQELCGVEDQHEPEILTIEEAERLIHAARTQSELNLLVAIILGLFCGIRSEELQKLTWDDIHMDQKFVKVSASIAKKRRIRNVDIPDNALVWLENCENREGLITQHSSPYRLRFMRLLRKAGFVDKSGRESERQVYLSARNGNLPFKQLRIARGLIEIPKACLSVIGGIQPSAILKNFDLKDDGDGLFQRFSFMCYPDFPEIDVVAEPADQRIKNEYHRIVENLFQITRNINNKPMVIPFDQETTDAYLTWSNGLMRDVRSAVLPSVLISHIAKFPKMLCTVALITEILKNGLRNRCIGIESWRTALLWHDYERSQARRIYSFKKTEHVKTAKLLAKKIRKGNLGKQFSYRELARKGWSGFTDPMDMKAALAVLLKCNWIKLVQVGESKAEVFVINPQLVKD